MAKEKEDKKEKKPTKSAEQIDAEKAAKAAKKAEHAAAAKAAVQGSSGSSSSDSDGGSKKKDEPVNTKFPEGYVARLAQKYKTDIAPAIAKELEISNPLAIPRVTKVVISMGLGKAITEKPRLEIAVKELTAIAGQKAVICKAKKSVSNFKLREGMEIGAKVTLRGQRMWEFLDRLINLALPRVKDFRGLRPKGFDHAGNYNFGLTEQTVFPEVNADTMTFQQGMNITIVTTAGNSKNGFALLKHLGMPFQVEEANAKKAG
jgi:large subunit ribosomal protein L5